MDKKYQLPTTKYENIADYFLEVTALNDAMVFSKNILSNFQKVDHSKAGNSLIKKQKELEKNYKDKLNKNDYYEFHSLNNLEKFLIDTKLFDKAVIKKSMLHEDQRISKAVDLGLSTTIGCWLTLLEDNKVEYVTRTRIMLDDFSKFNEFYGKLKD